MINFYSQNTLKKPIYYLFYKKTKCPSISYLGWNLFEDARDYGRKGGCFLLESCTMGPPPQSGKKFETRLLVAGSREPLEVPWISSKTFTTLGCMAHHAPTPCTFKFSFQGRAGFFLGGLGFNIFCYILFLQYMI